MVSRYEYLTQALDCPTPLEMLNEYLAPGCQYLKPNQHENSVFAINTYSKYMVSGNSSKELTFHDLDTPENSFTFLGVKGNRSPNFRFSLLISSYPFEGIYFNIGRRPIKRGFSRATPRQSSVELNLIAELKSSPLEHFDSISAVNFTRRPAEMIISGSRDGVIKVFQ